MTKIITNIKSLEKEHLIFLTYVCSIISNMYIACITTILYSIYIVFTNKKILNVNIIKSNILIILLLILSLLVSIYFKNTTGVYATLFGFIIYIVFIHYKYLITKELLKKFLKVLIISSIVCAVIGIIQYINIYLTTNSFAIQEEPELRVYSLFSNASYYSTYLEFILLIILFNIFKFKKELSNKNIIILLLAFTINIILLYMTGTRTAFGALALALLALLLALKYYKTVFAIIIVELLFIYLFIFLFPVFPRVDSMFDYFLGRVDLWVSGLNIFKLNPLFGEGPTSYAHLYEVVNGPKNFHSHSIYIEPLSNFGILGCTLLISYLVKGFINVLKNIKSEYFALVISIIVVTLIHGIGDISIISFQILPIFIFLIACLNYTKNSKQ